jgi:hypothetical protein
MDGVAACAGPWRSRPSAGQRGAGRRLSARRGVKGTGQSVPSMSCGAVGSRRRRGRAGGYHQHRTRPRRTASRPARPPAGIRGFAPRWCGFSTGWEMTFGWRGDLVFSSDIQAQHDLCPGEGRGHVGADNDLQATIADRARPTRRSTTRDGTRHDLKRHTRVPGIWSPERLQGPCALAVARGLAHRENWTCLEGGSRSSAAGWR